MTQTAASDEREPVSACPHCGHSIEVHQGHGDITYLLCDGCGAVTSFRPNLKGQAAITAFNRRVTIQLASASEQGDCGCEPNACKHYGDMIHLCPRRMMQGEQNAAQQVDTVVGIPGAKPDDQIGIGCQPAAAAPSGDEPTVQFCTVREGGDEWHLECRMSDGQKGAFVTVAYGLDNLAHRIADFLNSPPSAPEPESAALAEWLESQDFYELCQKYRHAKDYIGGGMLISASEAFDELKRQILEAPLRQPRAGREGKS